MVFFLYTGLVFLIVFLGVSLLLFFIMAKDYEFDREKSSSFECGFDGKDSARLVFSLRFFFLLILFIMFDIELCLLAGVPFYSVSDFLGFRLIFFMMFMILLMGVLEEWRRGLLHWN